MKENNVVNNAVKILHIKIVLPLILSKFTIQNINIKKIVALGRRLKKKDLNPLTQNSSQCPSMLDGQCNNLINIT